mmetsp:Transcript_4423/g.9486  ORF Transcript_4423/g.9486 Transcript_4423/m.9486 type:complete len:114 (-) Transcript_4423:93-434(-)
MSLQDLAYLPVAIAIVKDRGLPIDVELTGPDCRQGTPLSVALEQRVRPVEAPLLYRSSVVATLLALRADPTRRGRHVSWCGTEPSQGKGLLDFAVAGGCDAATLALLKSAGAR